VDLLQNNFDPVTFLEIDTTASSVEEVFKLRTELNKQIGEYLILKLSQSLTGEQQDQLSEETQNWINLKLNLKLN